jgi:protein-S-isoprenylcysteine O-methyltransferase Ste14
VIAAKGHDVTIADRASYAMPCRYMRHPMYSGLILVTTGVGAASSDSTRMLFAIGLAALLTVKSDFEERALIEVYGDEYRSYQSKVKRFGFL